MSKKILYFVLAFTVCAVVQTTWVEAQAKYSIKEMTPAVSGALESRKGRFDQLKDLKSQGMVGENNKGYVEALVPDAEVKALVEAENKDRRTIYVTIAEQNDLKDALSTIETVFAQVQREKAEPGEKVQDESSVWMTK